MTECTPQQVVDFLYLEACRDVLDGYPQQQTALTLRWVAGYIQAQYGLSSGGNGHD